jgi:hypothetical protein
MGPARERAKAPFTLGNRQDAFVERESKLYRRLAHDLEQAASAW